MKKLCTLFLVMVMALSVMSASAKGNIEKSDTKGSETKSTTSATSGTKEKTSNSTVSLNDQGKKQENIQKKFKAELNEQKKNLQKQKSSLNKQKEELQAQYDTLIASGDTAGAEAVMVKINGLNEQINAIQEEIKKTINERYMVVKTMYSDTELEQFNNASHLINQMYADAILLDASSVTANNNIIKFDAPAYIKGGVTLVPLRAISEELGCQVAWDGDTNMVTITKDGTIIKISANSTTVLVDGSPVKISNPAEVTCGRTYLPLRFLAETLNFNVTWDSENQIIDIDNETTTNTAGDTTSTDTISTASSAN